MTCVSNASLQLVKWRPNCSAANRQFVADVTEPLSAACHAVCKGTGTFFVTKTYHQAGRSVRAGECQACVSRKSDQTVAEAHRQCYKSVQNGPATGCGALRATVSRVCVHTEVEVS